VVEVAVLGFRIATLSMFSGYRGEGRDNGALRGEGEAVWERHEPDKDGYLVECCRRRGKKKFGIEG